MSAPIFLYGTLLDPAVLSLRGGDARLARRMVPAILLRHRRVALRGTPWPTLKADQQGAVAGELIRPHAAALRRLAAYEGAEYRLCPVRVLTPRGPLRARAWMAPPWRAGAASWP
jgi:gamma-glutamylcyclotransferase (GGCT)/AIG2-like uncharacterized protein YtfP